MIPELSEHIIDLLQDQQVSYLGLSSSDTFVVMFALELVDPIDLQHHLFLLTFDNKLGLAPPNLPGSNVERVLDVGTGTGIWAIDFADDHPEAEVLGIDLSPIQPPFVPPNVEFLIDDIDEEWDYSAPFSYIYSTMMNMSIQNWEDYLRKMFDNLTPGGHVELQDIDAFMKSDDGTLAEAHALSKWCNLLREAAVKLGRPYIPTKELKEIMDKVGFTNIVETRFKWPSNCWPKDKKYKELGAWNNENTNLVLESITLAPLTRGLNWTIEEVNVLLVDVRKELNDSNIHAYWPMYASRPLTSVLHANVSLVPQFMEGNQKFEEGYANNAVPAEFYDCANNFDPGS
ncbi:hypothetical protein FOXYSP1_20455 [Fusarium oxysporum f. sp. phaseoli]